MDVNCPNCGKSFSRIGHHWSMSSECSEPKLSGYQKDLITGLLLGDGSITVSDGRKPQFSIEMVNKDFIQWVDEQLDIFSTGNIIHIKNENKNDTYILNSRRLKQLEQFRNWYSSGEKRFPDDLELTPLILKLWYCTDGGKSVDDRWTKKEYARISSKNESDRKQFINSKFENLNFSPNWNDKYRFTFGREGSYDFWDYIGDPLPGFKYKWPDKPRPKHL